MQIKKIKESVSISFYLKMMCLSAFMRFAISVDFNFSHAYANPFQFILSFFYVKLLISSNKTNAK